MYLHIGDNQMIDIKKMQYDKILICSRTYFLTLKFQLVYKYGVDEKSIISLNEVLEKLTKRKNNNESIVFKSIEEYQKLNQYPNFEIEDSYRDNYPIIAGLDEAGRGPLAGPVVAAAVILPNNANISDIGINDSKKISEQKKAQKFQKISFF